MKRTIRSILQEMKESVEHSTTQSPVWWLDRAMWLNILWQDLLEEKTKYEMMYKSEMVDKIEEGMKISQAKLWVEGKSKNYKMYSYLHGRDKMVEEFIRLAKRRARTEESF